MDDIIATNPQSQIPYLNKINLTGSVVHKYRPQPDVIILTIAVGGSEIHDVDYPNVVFYGETIAGTIDRSIVVEERHYPRVSIEGNIQTTRRETPDGVRFYQNVVGTRISRTQTQMERLSGQRGLGTRKADSENAVCVLGQVTNVHPITRIDSERVIGAIVTIRTQIDGRTNYPRFTCFGGHVSRALAFKPGDIICATGYMETSSKTRDDGSRVRYESIIATELAKTGLSEP